MLFDALNLFSDDQAITANAASTNVIPLSVAKDIGPGQPLPLRIQVTEVFNNLTSLKVGIQVDDNDAFSSAKTVAEATVLLADLAVGKVFPLESVPFGTDEEYMRLYYTVAGTAPTTGKVTAGIVAGHQTNK